MSETPGQTLESGTNALVLASTVSDDKHEKCRSLLDAADLSELNVLRVSYTRTPESLIEDWRGEYGALPRRMYVIRVRERVGSPDLSLGADADSVTVAMANPNDLTGMAMRLRDVIADTDREDGELVVCFDSVTSLLQYSDVEPAYKFLHMFTGQLKDVGARAHFHLDPDAYDEKTVARIRSVFDQVVTVD